ncbi:MAG: hypothetical protein KIT11_04635 [Fimbriimonadaceae bacterium]|nr:hypothetical protein [Fimbriimonadaceae bacterium]QYK56820.1 MAG: hypothetical protein KF733_04890 [Fimbriimonadaceae bacterium]
MPADRRDGFVGFLGLLVFLAGVGLVAFTFYRAFQMFSTPPRIQLGISVNEPMDLNAVASNFLNVVVQVLLLAVMGGIGSLIANRGVKLYAASRGAEDPAPKRDRKEPKKAEPAPQGQKDGT